MNVTSATISTRATAESEPVKTNITFDWSGMTEEDIAALAQQALIVKLQGGYRKNGIPEGDVTVKVSDHKVGSRAPRGPVNIVSAFSALSAEEKAELLARLQAQVG